MASADASLVGSGFEISRILEEQRRQDEKRRVKRAANRKSASTSRARKKAYVDDMTAKNERMRQHALVLSMLPDLVLAVCRSGEMTYVSPACQWLLLHSPEEITGANIFELVTHDCHPLLRKMISDNLSRPVHAHTAARSCAESECSEEEASRSDGEGCAREIAEPSREKMGNHRERLQKRYRQSQAVGSSGSCVKDGRRGTGCGAAAAATPVSKEPKMLRLIRCDKTTVWCESRLSVRNTKSDGNVASVPLEIILTLRTISEGKNTTEEQELAGGCAAAPDRSTSEQTVDADDSVEADDDGYQCEVEEDGNNSGSGNDSGTTRNGHIAGDGEVSGSGGCAKKRAEVEVETTGRDPLEGREERSLSKKRRRVSASNRMEGMVSAANDESEKPEGDGSSTGGDTGGSTTQEGSVSCGNWADSNGEGSNNDSKWGDGCGDDIRFNNGSRCDGSEDGGTSDGTSAEGTDFGDEVQSAVQSLILMGGNFSKGAQ